ncbi:MAG: hypothetical protein AAF581_23255 [Planctomycetota bacterium]
MNAPVAAGGLSDRLANSHVGLRPELQFSRHLFRGKVSYIVRDPVTFESHRVTAEDYEIIATVRPERSLGETFEDLVQKGKLDAESEEAFYEFIVSLHGLGFLSLGISDSSRLYRRYQMKQRAKRRSKILGIMFLQIPLFNPDAFLTRTIEGFRFLFSRWFLGVWCLLVGSASTVVAMRWDDFSAQFSDMFAAQNLLVLWITLITLKVFHELGHAYATKTFGGHVPEMGAYLIAFTPCAYVDASASWGFTRKRHRILVGMAGMYVELIFAAAAAIVWSVTAPGAINSAAHNIVMLASVVTIGFNVNPLMRFDGYYALSDALEIPNLRQRGSMAIAAVAKRIALGIKPQEDDDTLPTRVLLCVFGVAGALYRIVVVLSISALIATKLFLLGLVLGFAYIGAEIFRTMKKTLAFLWWDPRTADVRPRAIAVSVVLLGSLAAILFLSPMSAHVHADGIIGFEQEAILRAEQPGFLNDVLVQPGASVEAGSLIAQLWDAEPHTELARARGRAEQATILARSLEHEDSAEAARAWKSAEAEMQRVRFEEQRVEKLALRAPFSGKVMRCLPQQRHGGYIPDGEEVAVIGSGIYVVTLLLSADDVRATNPQVGDLAEFRPAGAVADACRGEITRVEPVGDAVVREIALTQHGGGSIAVDPNTSESTNNYFQVVVALPEGAVDSLRYGMRGYVRLDAAAEPLGMQLLRKVILFVKRLDAS